MKSLFTSFAIFFAMYSFAQMPELMVQTGHQSSVDYISISPDGTKMFSVESLLTGTGILWDLTSGKQLRIFRNAVAGAFYPDSRSFLVAYKSKVFKAFDLSGNIIKSYSPKLNWAYFMVGMEGTKLNADKGILLNDGNVTNAFDRTENKIYDSHNAVDYVAAKELIASGADNNIVAILNSKTGETQKRIDMKFDPVQSVTSVSFSKDNNLILAAGDADKGSVNIVDISTGNILKIFTYPYKIIKAKFADDGKNFLILSPANLSLINAENGNTIWRRELIKKYQGNYASNFESAGKRIVLWKTEEKIFKIFDSETGANLPDIKTIAAGKTGTLQLLTDQKILTSRADGLLLFWNLNSGKLEKPSGNLLPQNTIATKQVGTFRYLSYPGNNRPTETSGTFSPDGKYYVRGMSDGTIDFYDVSTRDGDITKRINAHVSAVLSISFSKNGQLMFTSGYDNTIKIWNAEKRILLATLYSFPETDDWAVVTPDGHFDATKKAQENMFFVKGETTIALSELFEKFYTPNLLPRILEGENFAPLPINIITLKDAPKVKITAAEMQRNLTVEDDAATYNTTKEQVTIKVQADCPNDGVTEIRLFQNGKLVETTRNLLVEDENKSEKSLTKTFTVNLSAGNNSFKTVAFNTERTESKPAEIIVNYKPANNEQPVIASTTLHLIVVGVNTYKNPKYNLNYALADATSFSEAITVGSKNLFSNTNSIFIKNEEATKEGITAAFEKIKAAAKPQDLFIFYYAGHGTMNDKNEFFLVPYDVTQIYGNDGALAQNGFSSALLKQMSKDIKAQKQLFILDACHSAAALEAVAGARGAPEEKAIAQLARATGTYWLTASSSDQYASEFSQLGHGSFTYCLLQAFKGDANPTDKKLTVKILDAYLQTKVPEITQKYKGTAQYPASYGYGNDFPILIVK